MSVSGEVSHFSRFAVKFVEIVAAGMATAISGYLIAHLSGYSPAAAPPAVQVAPQAGAAVPGNAPPAAPISADAGAQRVVPQQDASPAAQPPRPAASQTAPARKSANAATNAPAAASAPESKPRDTGSIEAEVRAALAKIDASRKAPPDARPRQAAVPPAAVAPPADGAVATPPRAAAAAAPQFPAPSDQPAAVEIKSLPVATVPAATVEPPAPQAKPGAQADAQGNGQDNAQAAADSGFVSALKRIPDMLRSDQPVPFDKAPRPPMPVGE